MESTPPERHHGDEASTTVALLRAYHERGDTTARRRLVELYLPLVESFARRYGGRTELYEDLYQVGCIGLINAIDRFEPERGDELAAFAVPNIAGEIRRHLRDQAGSVRLPRRIQELRAPARRAQGELGTKLGRAPTALEVARELGADERDVALALEPGAAALSLDAAPGDAAAGAGADELDAAEDRLFLEGAARGLSERERRILHLRYVRDLPAGEIAEELGISPRQLARDTQAALAKLRDGLERGGATAPARSGAGASPADAAASSPGAGAAGRDPAGSLHGAGAAGRDPAGSLHGAGVSPPDPVAEPPAGRSGRLLLRLPQSLHAALARAAEHDDVSLNRFIIAALESSVAPHARPVRRAPATPRVQLVVLGLLAVLAVVLVLVALSR